LEGELEAQGWCLGAGMVSVEFGDRVFGGAGSQPWGFAPLPTQCSMGRPLASLQQFDDVLALVFGQVVAHSALPFGVMCTKV